MAYEIMIDAPPGSINHKSWKLRAFIIGWECLALWSGQILRTRNSRRTLLRHFPSQISFLNRQRRKEAQFQTAQNPSDNNVVAQH